MRMQLQKRQTTFNMAPVTYSVVSGWFGIMTLGKVVYFGVYLSSYTKHESGAGWLVRGLVKNKASRINETTNPP